MNMFWWFIIGVILLDIVLSWLNPKRCPVCGTPMLEYDAKPKHDYCPNESKHPKEPLYDTKNR